MEPVRQRVAHPLWHGIADGARFYFAHSHVREPRDPDLLVGSCDHDGEFAAAIACPGFFACRFHPEKSSTDGPALLANLVARDGR